MRIEQSEVYLKVCVTSILGVFSRNVGPVPFVFFFSVAFNKMFREKKNTTFLRPPQGISGQKILGILIFHHVQRIFDLARSLWTFPLIVLL